MFLVQPDRFGLKGKILAQATVDAPVAELIRASQTGLAQHRPFDKTNDHDHVRAGHWAGVFYEPPLPVTDLMEKQARDKGKKKLLP